MMPRIALALLLAAGLAGCTTAWPPGFTGPLGTWIPDHAASPTPWTPAAVAGNVAGQQFVDGRWR